MTQTNIAALRENYTKGSLDVSDVNLSPFDQFQKWFDEAVSSELLEPNALLLSTVSNEGKPSARIVLLKGLDNGFKFYSNYLSRKGTELIENPNACITGNSWDDLFCLEGQQNPYNWGGGSWCTDWDTFCYHTYTCTL